MRKYLISDSGVTILRAYGITPTGHECIERRYSGFDISSKVPLKVLRTDMYQHVHSLKCRQPLYDRKWQTPEIVRVEKSEVQPPLFKGARKRQNGFLSRANITVYLDTKPFNPRFRSPYEDLVGISYMYRRKRRLRILIQPLKSKMLFAMKRPGR